MRPGSPLEGAATADLDLTAYPGLVLIGLQSGGGHTFSGEHVVEAGDVLVVTGDPAEVSRLVITRCSPSR